MHEAIAETTLIEIFPKKTSMARKEAKNKTKFSSWDAQSDSCFVSFVI